MLRIRVLPLADFSLGIIQQRHRGETEKLAAIEAAYLRCIVQLRAGEPWIWSVASEHHDGASELHVSPLIVHFRWIDDDTIAILDFQLQGE
jgi:hypothetical protein